jgi:hypothetical protein
LLPNGATGWIDEWAAIVDDDTDQVISTSWGLCEAETGSSAISEEATLFEQAATQGQTIFAAAGDPGSQRPLNQRQAALRVSGSGSAALSGRRHAFTLAASSASDAGPPPRPG